MIEVRGLTKRYGDVVAGDDVSLDVEQELVTGVLGRPRLVRDDATL